ncbi:recombinase family protein [Actinomyces gaoshouyii]|uniref:recombinase family protein n=1 Tax=Actinomyces gaoshouyii TaxID=1960083 RepID=UPI0009BCF3E7|nr:recombinase family protein [Actinomyces gaoshouyii]ARD42475.1 transposase [Actinomyces gaoshouyii]
MQHHTRPAPAGQRIGYARVSTIDQNLDRQIAALGDVDRLFTDEASGSSRDRPGLAAALAYVRAGDELVVTSMDRLARSVRDLADLVDELTGRGVAVTFLREAQTYGAGQADPMSRLLLGVLGAVAEFERAIIRERQAEGIAAAKRRGAYTGRARALSEADIPRARARVAAGMPKAVVARDLGVHRSTLHRALNQQTE